MEELLGLDERLGQLEMEVKEESESVRGVEEEIEDLKVQVVEAQEEQSELEVNHTTLIRAKDDLRSDALYNKYF